ncbi:MAG: fused response regulator/phosphatase [Holophagales bacterium]|nr:fused response regulator/phosphatase [Holophagales bacterium]
MSRAELAGSGERPRILVVDDEPSMLRAVERILQSDYEIFCDTAPLAALDIARREEPHLAIVDVQMPVMDGFELTRALRQLDPQLRVILMTGSAYGTDEKLIRAVEEEAFYFVYKPFDRAVLRALVGRCLQLRALEDENRRYLRHLESQMAEARAFQRTMLPAAAATLDGLEVNVAYHPSTELAGDLCDYTRAGPGVVALLIGDVVGHGASAAMLTALVKSAFHASHVDSYDPREVVRRVSENLAAFDASRFVTLLSARIFVDVGRLEYVNAGHEGGFLGLPGEKPVSLASTGPLISPALLGMKWQQRDLPWRPESRLLLFTDGITEAASTDGEELGIDRTRELFAKGARGKNLLDTLLREVEAFSPGPASDDRTLLTVHSPAID